MATADLQDEESHGDEAHPAVHGVEVAARWLREVLGLKDGQEPQDYARDGQCVKDHVEQFHVDLATAPTDTVEQHS